VLLATRYDHMAPSRLTQLRTDAGRLYRAAEANEPKTMHVQGVIERVQGVIERGWFDTYTTDRGRRPAQQVVASTLPDATS